jgi:GR25 family glycosyltransferase involved in LPS biosynthesis
MFPIYYINLQSEKKRNEFMKKQFDFYSLQSTRIEAYHKNIPYIQYLVKRYKIHNPNELCCFVSHIKAIHEAYKNNDPYCIVMEDNVELEHFVKNSNMLQYFTRYTNIWECINLLPTGPNTILQDNIKNYKKKKLCTPYKKVCYGTKVLLYNRKGIEKLVKMFPRIEKSIQGNYTKKLVADNFIFSYCKTYISTFPFGNISLLFDTSIHKNSKIEHRKYTKHFIHSMFHST